MRDGEFLHLSVNGGDRGSRALGGESAGQFDQMFRQVQPALIVARQTRETGKSFGTVAPEPALQRPLAQRAGAGEVRERDAIGEGSGRGSARSPAAGQRRMRHRRRSVSQVRKTEICLPIAIESACHFQKATAPDNAV
jgi:hypothetical protein